MTKITRNLLLQVQTAEKILYEGGKVLIIGQEVDYLQSKNPKVIYASVAALFWIMRAEGFWGWLRDLKDTAFGGRPRKFVYENSDVLIMIDEMYKPMIKMQFIDQVMVMDKEAIIKVITQLNDNYLSGTSSYSEVMALISKKYNQL